MAHPTSSEEYLARFHASQRIDGFGAGTTVHVPCPFCAAPDFASWKILEVEKGMREPGTCKECKRSCKTIFHHTTDGVSFEIVQTGGPDQPEWLTPHMRRVDQ